MRRLAVICVTVLAVGCSGSASNGPADEKSKTTEAPARAQPASQESGDKAEARFKGKPVSVWVRQLQDRDVATRADAARALEALGAQARAAVPDLKTAMKERAWELLTAYYNRDADRVFTVVGGLIGGTGGGVPSKDAIIADLRSQLEQKKRELADLHKKEQEFGNDPCLRALGLALLAIDRREMEAMFPAPVVPARKTFTTVSGTIGSTSPK
jgi:hypothetical protein